MRSLQTFLIVFCLASAVVVAGCGGGGSSTTQPATLSSQQVVKRAAAICGRANEQQTNLLKEMMTSDPTLIKSKAGQEKALVAAGLPPVKTAATQLSEIPAADAQAGQLESLAKSMNTAISEGEENPATLLGLTKQDPFKAVDTLAKKYGFNACVGML